MTVPKCEDIKARYPKPVRTGYGDYCVGQALCMYVGYPTQPFPGPSTISSALRQANPNLGAMGGRRDSYERALTIINNNDAGRFSKAWTALCRALDYRRPTA